jgi:hypothetical protein
VSRSDSAPANAGPPLWIPLALVLAAVSMLALGFTTDPNTPWPFVTLVVIAVLLNALGVLVGHRCLRAREPGTNEDRIAVAIVILSYVVLVPLGILLLIWLIAGLGAL